MRIGRDGDQGCQGASRRRLGVPVQASKRAACNSRGYEEDIEQAIQIILLTASGERVDAARIRRRPARFRVRAEQRRDARAIEETVRKALIDWEPRINLERVEVTPDDRQPNRRADPRRLRGARDQHFYNRVFPFYLLEGRRVDMPIESPQLDDLRYDARVEELIRRIPVYAPEWTDHNDSDPGITLIQLFAHLAEQIGYRLNRIPEKNHIELLKLLGVRLQPARAARDASRASARPTRRRSTGFTLSAGARASANERRPASLVSKPTPRSMLFRRNRLFWFNPTGKNLGSAFRPS